MGKKVVLILMLLASIVGIWRFGCLVYFHVWAGSFAEGLQRNSHLNHAIWFSIATIVSCFISVWISVYLYRSAGKNKQGAANSKTSVTQ
jgi:uncharacterized membrane protein